jgi:hypothetical protein
LSAIVMFHRPGVALIQNRIQARVQSLVNA